MTNVKLMFSTTSSSSSGAALDPTTSLHMPVVCLFIDSLTGIRDLQIIAGSERHIREVLLSSIPLAGLSLPCEERVNV